jgi:hypothetical protein
MSERPDIEERVYRFAELMIAKLRLPENEAKGGWRECSEWKLLQQVEEEVVELEYAMNYEGADAAGKEAADVANIAMMIADNLGCLDTEFPTAYEVERDRRRVAEAALSEAQERIAALEAAVLAYEPKCGGCEERYDRLRALVEDADDYEEPHEPPHEEEEYVPDDEGYDAEAYDPPYEEGPEG